MIEKREINGVVYTVIDLSKELEERRRIVGSVNENIFKKIKNLLGRD